MEALTITQQALQLCDPDWQVWRATILNTVGVIHMNLRQYELARRFLGESLALSQNPSGRKVTAVHNLLDFARLELLNSRLPAAFDALEQALRLATEIKSVPLQAEALQALFRLYLAAHDPERADEYHEAYLQLQRQIETERVDKRMGLIRAEAQAEKQRPAWLQESLQFVNLKSSPSSQV